MPTIPTPEELGSLPRLPGARPVGGYDLSPYASGAREIADAGARFGQAIEDIGRATFKIGRQHAITEAVNANAFIHARLIEARERYRDDPDHATLAQRWSDEAGKIVEDGLSQISNEGLREHVRSKLAVPLAQENAAIQNQAFRGAANAHAAGRDRYLRYLVDHITLDPEDKLLTGGVDALHAAIDDAVTQRFATPEQALQEKRRSALALCAGHYARMSRVDPGLAIRELESPENGHPLLPHLPQQLRESLIQQAQDQQENDVKDAEHAALRRQQESQRASDQAENQIVANLMSETPTLTRTDISANQKLSQTAKPYMLALAGRAAAPDPDATTSNLAARGLLDRVRLPDGDPSKVASLAQIYDAYIGGKLSKDDFNFVRKEFFASRTPAEAPLLAHKQAFLKGVAPEIDRSDPLIGDIDQLGRAKMYLLERDIDRKIGQYLKDGKDPIDLFDRSKPDYVGKPESLERYRTTARETLEENARQLRSTNASGPTAALQPVPRRLSGETPSEYLGRINAALPDIKVRVPPSW
ncbi:MAG TPA: hypothetical protein VKC66_36670 [Xanthobacteraceae bacterium]|nr:hypothetical protein [Xanthobacteraceae bacterium]